MILTCPECQTRYQTDPAQFPREGRKVRCAKCGHIWHQTAPEPEHESPPVAAAAVQAESRSADFASFNRSTAADEGKPQRTRRSWAERLGLLAGWTTLAVVIGLIGWTTFRFREDIATLWPQSSSIFATFGVALNAHGLSIDNTSYRRETANGQPVWIVTGKLVNRSAHDLVVPPVRVALTDGARRELYHWTVRPPQRILKPGQILGFSARIPSPPAGAREVQLGFAGQE
ncbi:MAG TPA: DUF3426 domain-containing protein [Rhizomicrobium sp.]|jgi:predicted Zn finger-like uncharacterized protein